MGLRAGMAGNVQARAALVALEGAAPGQVFSLGNNPDFCFFYSSSPSGRVGQALSRSRERGWLDSGCWDVHALFPNPCKAAV